MIASRQRQDKDAQCDLYSVIADALDSESGGLRQSELWAEANIFLLVGKSLLLDPTTFLVEFIFTK